MFFFSLAGNAVAQVFPDTPHRWCIWHVLQNATNALAHKAEWEFIRADLQEALHDSLTISEFENAWKKMIDNYGLQENKWLAEMYGKRNRWVPVWFKDIFGLVCLAPKGARV